MIDLTSYTGIEFAEHRAFWQGVCDGAALPWRWSDPKRTPSGAPLVRTSAEFGSAVHILSRDSVGALARMAGDDPLHQDVVLMSVLFLLLSKYTHSQTVAFITPSLLPEEASRFVLLKVDVPSEGNLSDWIGLVRDLVCASYQYQDYPLVLVKNVLTHAAAVSNVMFRDPAIHGLDNASTPEMDLIVEPARDTDRLQLKCSFRVDRFSRESITRFCEHFDALMNCYGDPSAKLMDCSMILPADTPLALLRGAKQDHPGPSTLTGLFEQQVSLTPDAIAVRDETGSLSYAELDRLSANLAAHLHGTFGAREDRIVGIMLDKSPRMIVAMLAAMKAGCGYVPLDPAYPLERLEMIFQDSRMKVLLIDSAAMFSVEGFDGDVFVMDLQLKTLPDDEAFRTGLAQPDSLAYLIYTSGSTGTPKGVMIEQRAISNTIRWRRRYYGMGPGHVVLQFASISFDSSVEDIFTPLSCGAALLLPGASTRTDLSSLAKLIEAGGVTHLLMVPSLYQVLLEEAGRALHKLVAVTVAGEACPQMLIARHHALLPHVLLVNEYGPTENSVCSTVALLQDGAPRVTIGTPIDNGHVRILDPQLAVLPAGIVGQIGLGGPGLARGYWQSESLTRTRFNSLRQNGETERVYLSGDLGRIRDDGNLEFLGRMDEQVKINGYRVEPGEVEFAMRTISGVAEVVVRARSVEGGKPVLVAWYTSAGTNDIGAQIIKTNLKTRLPSFLVPEFLIHLPCLPRTPNGKVDIAALQAPHRDERGANGFVGPRNDAESRLAEIWADVFEVDQVGVDDDFFSLHGDSITALRLLYKIENAFGVQMQIDDIYRFPAISQLASHLVETRVEEPADLAERREALSLARLTIAEFKQRVFDRFNGVEDTSSWQDVFPLTAIEKGLLFQSLLSPELAMHHDQFCLDFVDGNFAMDRLRHAASLLYRTYEILRSSYRVHGLDEPAQIIHRVDAAAPDVQFTDLRHLDERQQQAAIADLMMSDRACPFDPVRPGLLRFYVLRRTESRYTLLNVSHHLILDGWSHNVLLDALFDSYESLKRDGGFAPKHPAVSFAEERAHRLAVSGAEGQLAFWRGELDGFVRTPLPLQRTYRPGEPGMRVREFSITPDPGLSRGLVSVAERLQVGVKHVHVGAFAILMAALSQSDDITFGLVTNIRPIVPDADRLVGNYLNSVPFRIHTGHSGSIAEFLGAVRAKLTGMRPFEFLPLSDIAHGTEERAKQNPFFDVLFNYIDFRSAIRPNSGLQFRETGVPAYEATGYPIDFTLSVGNDDVRLIVRYLEPTYRESDIARIAAAYLRILTAINQDPSAAVDSIDWVDPEEAALLLAHLSGPVLPLPAATEGRTIDALFQNQARRTPGEIALVAAAKQLTYAELDELSSRLARHLILHCAIQIGDIVALSLPRDEWLVIAILAVHKAGGAYLPLDPAYPDLRRQTILGDSGAALLLCTRSTAPAAEASEPATVYLEDLDLTGDGMITSPLPIPDSNRLAYLIYTSGSTGTPKGVKVSHANLVNFFIGMDRAIQPQADDALLAVTNLTFDISILELLWTICRGIQVVMQTGDDRSSNFNRFLDASQTTKLDFSLFFFSTSDQGRTGTSSENPYQLLLDCSRYADEHEFKAVWTPERHFHPFGALFPNPAITSAAIAAITKNIQIRAGSVVAALHHPIRLAEEWAAVDQLSGGRVGLSFASGWHPDDFVLNPGAFAAKDTTMMDQLDAVRRLWRGESITFRNGVGRDVPVRVWPRPKQDEVPVWITAAGHPLTFQKAGEIGANLLTHLLGKDIAALAENIALYRRALSDNGFDPAQRTVTVMVHAYMGSDEAAVKRAVQGPLKAYLESSIDLARLAGDTDDGPGYQDLPPHQKELMLDRAFERYYNDGALIGTPEKCAGFVSRLHSLGVNELACLVDFGLGYAEVMDGLSHLARFKQQYKAPSEPVAADHKPITMLQTTPSMLSLLCRDDGSAQFLRSLKKIMIGGEPLPMQLLRDLRQVPAQLYNMYGPTETTVWSAVHVFPPSADEVSIGMPIANTTISVTDRRGRMLPMEVIGEIVIGGEGVSQGYHRRPELTQERFVDGPAGIGRAYRTGDLAYLRRDGTLRFLGRNDHQIKFNGHRVELGDLESHLMEVTGVRQAVVLLKDIASQPQMVAYLVHEKGLALDEVRRQLSQHLPPPLIPTIMVSLPELPQLASGKVDRSALAALPVPSSSAAITESTPPKFTETERTIAKGWAKVLKHDKFDADDNFFSVGGNSLVLVRLHSALRLEVPEPFTLMDLLIRPTVREFAAFVDRQVSARLSCASRVLMPLNEIRHDRDALLLIPSSLGDPAEYQNLLPWLRELNCYGLDLIGLKHELSGAISIEALAEKTCQILARELAMPLRGIVGYSFGVKLAIALAARLSGHNSSPQLILIDGNLHQEICFETPPFQTGHPSDEEQFDESGLRSEIEALRNAEAAFRFADSLNGNICCVEASNTPGIRTNMQSLRQITCCEFECHQFATTHYEILAKPAVDLVGPLVQHFIARSTKPLTPLGVSS
jgi:natural product biosynthesis luciferase-like monooxygenase protein/amino acid adenylation domain-containing protein